MKSRTRRLAPAAAVALVTLAAPLGACGGGKSLVPTTTLPIATIAEPAPTTTPSADAAVLAIDAAASKIEFTGRKVTGVHPGGFRAFDGEVRVGAGVGDSSVTLAIDTGSVFSDSERLTGHLKSPDFFDSAQHPKATFVSTAIVAGGAGGATHTVQGNLTLRGVTKAVGFPATLVASKDKVTLKAAFALDRQAFGIVYPGKANDLIADHVDLAFDIVATPRVAPLPAAPTDAGAAAAAAPTDAGAAPAGAAPAPTDATAPAAR
ncbi:MAG: YceI family protein [Deltaproteobacteria bacterium]|nr:YceI family protein [Deltaproteobacteria bacterium]